MVKRDYPGLDLVRFGAALLVTLYHLTYWWWLQPSVGEAGGTMWAGTAAVHSITHWGWVGVPIFFVLSGFVIAFTAEGKGAGQFLKNRALRLYPAAWLCATVTLVACRLGDHGAAGDYVRSVLLFPIGPWVDGVYWTLGIELIFYLCIAAVLALSIDLRIFATVLSIVGCLFPLLSFANVWSGQQLQPLIDRIDAVHPLAQMVLGYCPFFGLGMLFWSLSKSGYPRVHPWLLAPTALACLMFILGGATAVAEQRVAPTPSQVWPATIWLVATAAIAINIRWHGFFARILAPGRGQLRTLGLMTYPLYLVHSAVGREVALHSEKLLTPLPATGLAVVVVLILAWALLKAEDVPRSMLRHLLWPDPTPKVRKSTEGATI